MNGWHKLPLGVWVMFGRGSLLRLDHRRWDIEVGIWRDGWDVNFELSWSDGVLIIALGPLLWLGMGP